MVVAVPELLHVYANTLHVQVEKSTLKLLPSSQHVKEALNTRILRKCPHKIKAKLEKFCGSNRKQIGKKAQLIRANYAYDNCSYSGYRTKKLCNVHFWFCTLVERTIIISWSCHLTLKTANIIIASNLEGGERDTTSRGVWRIEAVDLLDEAGLLLRGNFRPLQQEPHEVGLRDSSSVLL
jgi:hypothetical protein